jgi:hypothetical protein
MKTLLLCISLVLPAYAEDTKWPLHTNKAIYSATVNGKLFTVYLSTGGFDESKHKIVPYTVTGEGDEAVAHYPKVDGHSVVGIDGPVPKAEEGFPHLTRLAVSFGDVVVEAPASLIAHVFMPHTDVTFDTKHQSGRVAISSDGQAMTVELGVGDGGAAGSVSFTFTSSGKCVLGLPEPPTP